MSRTLTNKFLMIIACLGVLVTIILTIEHFHPGAGGLCKVGANSCEGVLKSKYGNVKGIPTAILGLGMYLTFLYLGIERGKLLQKQAKLEIERAQAYAEGEADTGDTAFRPQIHKLDQLLWLMAASAFAMSWWLQYTALYVLLAFCPWCFSSALLVTLLFVLTSYDFHFAGKQGTGEKKMLVGISVFILVLMGFMKAPEIITLYQLIKQDIKKEGDVPPPSPANAKELIAKTRWWTGDANSKVMMVEFADYMCPTCKVTHEKIKEYLRMRPNAFRLGFLNFPVPIAAHKWARQAAVAAEAAGKQGKFWEMHDYLFQHQEEMEQPGFTPDRFNDFAGAIGLNVEKFRKAMADPKLADIVSADFALGGKNGVTGTPTAFFIKDDMVIPCVGPNPMQQVMMDRNHPLWKGQQ